MARTTFKQSQNYVYMTYENDMGEIKTRSFFVPWSGGYVRDENGSQVCNGLRYRGNTLICHDAEKLIDIIRKEYRYAKAQAKRDEARLYS